MAPFLEFEGKSVEKAVQKACKKLNIPKSELEHDVVSYGSTGIFGLVGTKRARIRVVLPESDSEHAPASPEKRHQDADSPLEPESQTTGSPPRVAPEEDPEVQQIEAQDDFAGFGEETLRRIVNFITTDAEIKIEKDGDRIVYNVKGGNPAVLIGKRGQTLEAMQYLVEKIVNKHSERRIRIQVDVEDYLANRKANLRGLAERLAEKAKRTGKPATIGQINSHDRRIVHMALKDDNGVRTQSMGDGFLRKLVIFPKKNYSRKRRSN